MLVFNFEDNYLNFTLGSDLQSYLNCISPLFKTIFMNSVIHSQIIEVYYVPGAVLGVGRHSRVLMRVLSSEVDSNQVN